MQGELQSATTTVTVSVKNEDDDPFVFQYSFYSVSLKPGQAPGKLDVNPASVNATSRDPGEPRYRLEPQNVPSASDYFSLDLGTGELSLTKELDGSVDESVLFLVKVSLFQGPSVAEGKWHKALWFQGGEGTREGVASLVVYLPDEKPTEDVEFEFESYSFDVGPVSAGGEVARINVTCGGCDYQVSIQGPDKDIFAFDKGTGTLSAREDLLAEEAYTVELRADTIDDVDIARVEVRVTSDGGSGGGGSGEEASGEGGSNVAAIVLGVLLGILILGGGGGFLYFRKKKKAVEKPFSQVQDSLRNMKGANAMEKGSVAESREDSIHSNEGFTGDETASEQEGSDDTSEKEVKVATLYPSIGEAKFEEVPLETVEESV
ncbi:unnamed protein product, partial [Darwinula stevensoni]